jgi:hypothetical protein
MAVALPRRAGAESVAEACVRAADEGQDARARGALLRAHESFAACATATCPKPLRADCTTWLGEVERDTPSVVVGVKDRSGADALDGRVMIDGVRVPRLDGAPIPVDPGPHTFRFERPGAAGVERAVVVRTGERNRLVVERLGEAPTPRPGPEPRPRSGLPTATWIFGGIGAAGLLGFGALGIAGLSEKSRLRSSCSPSCTDAQVSTLRGLYIGADVALGVGVLALGLAVYFALTAEGDAAH